MPQAFDGRLDDIGFVFSAKKFLANHAQRGAFFVGCRHYNISLTVKVPEDVEVLM